MAKNLYMCSEKATFAPGSKNLKPDKVFEDGVFIREEGTFCEFTSKLVFREYIIYTPFSFII